MTSEATAWRFWLAGLVLFAIAIALGMAVTQGDVTLGIIEHQSAGTAERVDEIQAQWRAGGVRGIAIAAMAADLVFIGVFAWGSYLLGRNFVATRASVIRELGLAIMAAAVVFCFTDYTETVLQFIQLLRDEGSEWMAGTAATVRPIKVFAWCVAFLGVLAVLVVRRISPGRA